ncbi:MAG TPA: glycosyltransferase, partial [Acidothermaceae bacterium]|nr:glycosyltransferase [Acidothermaceae bacterium]
AKMITEYLSTADIGISPEPLNPLNDVSTMNKTMEYMAFALPVVAFDLKETRVSAAEAAVYVEPGDIAGYAKAIAALLDDPDARAAMAIAGRQRAADVLDWEPQRASYVGVYDKLLRGSSSGDKSPQTPQWPDVDRRVQDSKSLVDRFGNRMVDLRRPNVVNRFVRTRRLLDDNALPSSETEAAE